MELHKSVQEDIDRLSIAIENNPEAALFNKRGDIYCYELHNLDLAISDYNNAIKLDSNNSYYFYKLGMAYLIADNYKLGIGSFTKAIELDIDNAEYYCIRGYAKILDNNYDEAFADYTKAIELDNDDASFYNRRGDAYRIANDFLAAIADYSRAIELDGNNASYYNDRALAYRFCDNYDEAIADYTKAIELDKGNASYYKNRGDVYRTSNNLQAAIADYSRAIELDGNNASYYNGRALAYRFCDNYDEAIADYTKAIELDKNNASYYNKRGDVYRAANNLQAAIADYSKAIELDGNNAYYFYDRGYAYLLGNNYDDALADCTKAIELDGSNALFYKKRGDVYRAANNLQAAIADYSRAIELDDNNASFYNDRALAYQSDNNVADALADFTKAIELDGNNAKYYSDRGYLFILIENLDEAISDFKKSISLNSDNFFSFYSLGAVYNTLGRLDDATHAYSCAIDVISRVDANESVAILITVRLCDNFISQKKQEPVAVLLSKILSYFPNSSILHDYVINKNYLFSIDVNILTKVNNPFFQAASLFLKSHSKNQKDIYNVIKKVYDLWNTLHVIDDDTDFIYQYTSKEVLKNMLENNSLRLTPVDYLNDPQEGKVLRDFLLDDSFIGNSGTNLCNSSLSQEDWTEFISNIFDNKNQIDNYNNTNQTDIVVFARSLTVHKDSLLMWNSSYGQNGEGIAIGIQKNNFTTGIGIDGNIIDFQRLRDTDTERTVNKIIEEPEFIESKKLGLYQIAYISTRSHTDCKKPNKAQKALSSIRKSLFKLFKNEDKDLYFDKIRYQDYLWSLSTLFTPIQYLIKDQCFSHEIEYRLLYISKLKSDSKIIKTDFYKGLYVNTDQVLFCDDNTTEVITGPLISYPDAQKIRHQVLRKSGKNIFNFSEISFR